MNINFTYSLIKITSLRFFASVFAGFIMAVKAVVVYVRRIVAGNAEIHVI